MIISSHLDRYRSFCKILILNLVSVNVIHNDNWLHILCYYYCNFSGDNVAHNLNVIENVNSNDWNLFKKRGLHLIQTKINSHLPKIDEVCYIAEVIKASMIGIYGAKMDDTILSNELEIDGYDLLRLD